MGDTRTPGYGQVDRDLARRFATTPPEQDGPVWMVNLMAYKPRAVYDGAEAELSGRDADDRYAPVDVLADIGAEVVFVGDVEEQLLGDAPRWDRVGIVRYPTRRSFIEMQARDDFKAKHAQTIVACCTPIPSPEDAPGAPEPVEWSQVPHPPSDGPVLVLHLCRFHPGMAETEMASYTEHAIPVAARHGGRVGAWFQVEGTIVGGRQWDQARFNAFPSKAAFMAVVLDPDRLRAQAEHREVALADTYTLILRPSLDRLAESVAGSSS
jgi:hypothetical protein